MELKSPLREFAERLIRNGELTGFIRGIIAKYPDARNAIARGMKSESDTLADSCLALGADPAAVGAWPDSKRRAFIEDRF